MVIESFVPWAQTLIIQFSYVGIFVVSLISTSTLFLPAPLYALIFFASGLGLNPFLTGIVSGVGLGLGELTGYFVGIGGRYVLEEKKRRPSKLIKFFTKFFKKYGFITLVTTAFFPFPFDFVGILSGASKYNIKKFLLATIIGKTMKTLLISYAGFLAIPWAEIFVQSF
jgi:membrane protein DedA with SNARE-associated domain